MAIEQPSDAAFACELMAWLKRKKLAYSTRLYSWREWNLVRKETMHPGEGVAWVMSIEGSTLYQILNGYTTPESAKYDQRIYDEFTKFCHERGWWWDMGYAWSVSLGPITDPEMLARLAGRAGG